MKLGMFKDFYLEDPFNFNFQESFYPSDWEMFWEMAIVGDRPNHKFYMPFTAVDYYFITQKADGVNTGFIDAKGQLLKTTPKPIVGGFDDDDEEPEDMGESVIDEAMDGRRKERQGGMYLFPTLNVRKAAIYDFYKRLAGSDEEYATLTEFSPKGMSGIKGIRYKTYVQDLRRKMQGLRGVFMKREVSPGVFRSDFAEPNTWTQDRLDTSLLSNRGSFTRQFAKLPWTQNPTCPCPENLAKPPLPRDAIDEKGKKISTADYNKNPDILGRKYRLKYRSCCGSKDGKMHPANSYVMQPDGRITHPDIPGISDLSKEGAACVVRPNKEAYEWLKNPFIPRRSDIQDENFPGFILAYRGGKTNTDLNRTDIDPYMDQINKEIELALGQAVNKAQLSDDLLKDQAFMRDLRQDALTKGILGRGGEPLEREEEEKVKEGLWKQDIPGDPHLRVSYSGGRIKLAMYGINRGIRDKLRGDKTSSRVVKAAKATNDISKISSEDDFDTKDFQDTISKFSNNPEGARNFLFKHYKSMGDERKAAAVAHASDDEVVHAVMSLKDAPSTTLQKEKDVKAYILDISQKEQEIARLQKMKKDFVDEQEEMMTSKGRKPGPENYAKWGQKYDTQIAELENDIKSRKHDIAVLNAEIAKEKQKSKPKTPPSANEPVAKPLAKSAEPLPKIPAVFGAKMPSSASTPTTPTPTPHPTPMSLDQMRKELGPEAPPAKEQPKKKKGRFEDPNQGSLF